MFDCPYIDGRCGDHAQCVKCLDFFINGFRETRSYFLNQGQFTTTEWETLVSGGTVEKHGSTYYFQKKERG